MTAPDYWPTAMVTGHRRPPKGCSPDWVADRLAYVAEKLRREHGTHTAISGMALFVDQLWAQTALNAGLLLHAAIPYPNQHEDPAAPANQDWTDEQKTTWRTLCDQATQVDHVSARDPRNPNERVRMLHARNDFMLAQTRAADGVVVGVWDPEQTRSGTTSCLRKAASAGLPIILVNMVAQTVTMPEPRHWALRLGIPVHSAS